MDSVCSEVDDDLGNYFLRRVRVEAVDLHTSEEHLECGEVEGVECLFDGQRQVSVLIGRRIVQLIVEEIVDGDRGVERGLSQNAMSPVGAVVASATHADVRA